MESNNEFSSNNRSRRRSNFGTARYDRKLDRSLLPSPSDYYSKQFSKFKIKSEWVKVSCCFHGPDKTPSLSISMVNGNFICHACGSKGCDVIAFHRLRYGMSFVETVNYFGAWNHE